jgi:hypothetical protein
VLVALFLLESTPTARGGAEWYHQRSLQVEALVQGVVAEHVLNPGKTILLVGIDGPQFAASVNQHAFAAFAVPNVFLAPGSDAEIAPANPGAVAKFVQPADQTEDALAHGAELVLESKDGHLTDITATYAPPKYFPTPQPQAAAKSQRVDIGDPRQQDQLGPEWYVIDHGFRWMPKRASVRFRGPVTAGQKLIVSGYCPAVQVTSGPLGMYISVDGAGLPPVKIDKGDAPFSFEFALPQDSRREITLEVEVERTFSTAADHRSLGLIFGIFEIR